MSDLDDIVKEFLVESHEGLDQLDRDLVALEQRPRDQELLAGIFRGIHTVKGTCGFLGFDKLESVSHVGELVLTRNQILQCSASSEDSVFHAASQRLNLITGELQEGVMKTRMLPIGNIWSKLPRVVRDLAVACAKQVRVEMEGSDTE